MKRAPWASLQIGGMNAADWVAVVSSQQAAPEVMQTCVDFLSNWTIDQRARLPETCKPPFAMSNHAHVSVYAFQLAQERLVDERPIDELDAMATFFAAAASRLSHLLAVPRGAAAPLPFFDRALADDADE